MDSTLITIETIDEIAKESGMSNEVASITEQAMQGKLDFTESFKKGCQFLKESTLQHLNQFTTTL